MGGIQTEYYSELGPAPLDAGKRIANRRSAARGRAALCQKEVLTNVGIESVTVLTDFES